MMPIAPLMIEHRLIERMIKQLQSELTVMQTTQQVHLGFIDIATDFFRVYSDFCHHGKEEHILFSDLESKPLLPEHKDIMEQLIQEHVIARQTVKELIDAKELWQQGNKDSLNDIKKSMNTLVTLYPAHIEKEDKHFFIPCMKYFTVKERDEMLAAFYDFDRHIIHELYNEKVIQLEQHMMQSKSA